MSATNQPMNPETRWAMVEAGWEGARQGLILVEGASDAAVREPLGPWACLAFGHGLYLAARRAAAAAGTEPASPIEAATSSTWQSISSCPSDGRRIYVARGNTVILTRAAVYLCDGGWWTHWMPAPGWPAPPEKSGR